MKDLLTRFIAFELNGVILMTLQHLEKLSTAPTVQQEKRCFPYLVHSFPSDEWARLAGSSD